MTLQFLPLESAECIPLPIFELDQFALIIGMQVMSDDVPIPSLRVDEVKQIPTSPFECSPSIMRKICPRQLLLFKCGSWNENTGNRPGSNGAKLSPAKMDQTTAKLQPRLETTICYFKPLRSGCHTTF